MAGDASLSEGEVVDHRGVLVRQIPVNVVELESAADVPILDNGGLFAAGDVENALAEVMTATNTKETPAGAQSKADNAQSAAISAAASDATTKADQAEADAIAAAAQDATEKADAALVSALAQSSPAIVYATSATEWPAITSDVPIIGFNLYPGAQPPVVGGRPGRIEGDVYGLAPAAD